MLVPVIISYHEILKEPSIIYSRYHDLYNGSLKGWERWWAAMLSK